MDGQQVTWLNIVTLIIAVVGAVLGLLTTWRTFNNDRVRLRIKASWSMTVPNGSEHLAIEVVNLSTFPVTVSQIGIELAEGKHIPLLDLHIRDGRLPMRLEPRTNLSGLAPSGHTHHPAFASAVAVYVDTACGLHLLGDRRNLHTALHNLNLSRRR